MKADISIPSLSLSRLFSLIVIYLAAASCTTTKRVSAFLIVPGTPKTSYNFPLHAEKETKISTSAPPSAAETPTTPTIVDRSTLTLLEHINFNIPNHDFAVPFYYDILGCGFDPRMAENIQLNKDRDKQPEAGSTIWANCGASQFHLCYNGTEPTLQGRIGLRYDSLEELQRRLQQHHQETLEKEDQRCFQSYTIDKDSRGNKQITIVDRYDNVFLCQMALNPHPDAPVASLKQPIVAHVDHFIPSLNPPDSETALWEDLACRFGRERSECQGVTFVEVDCPRGTAIDIATFYESVFDATTTVIPMQEHHIAMIAFGNIDQEGRADQYLLFKEQSTPVTRNIGHHIAMYVGETAADFEQAYKNAEIAGVIWINPRFADKVDSLPAAKQEKQFRFKNIVDLKTGKTVMEIEQEVRSVEHPSFPGHSS